MLLKEGQKAPDFTLPNQEGDDVKLSDFKGKWVLVYFYPKDNTVGCIREGCAIRDSLSIFKKQKIEPIGISVDNIKSHKKFAEKNEFTFHLLADTEKEVVQAYDVWGQKNFIGREYMGIHRMSFLIDPDGKIAKIYEKVKPAAHAQEVLDDQKLFCKERK